MQSLNIPTTFQMWSFLFSMGATIMGLHLSTYKKHKSLSRKTGYLYRVFLHLQASQRELNDAIKILQKNEPWYDDDKNTQKSREIPGNN